MTEEEKKELIEKRITAMSNFKGYRGEVFSKSNIRAIKNLEVNEIFWVEAEDGFFVVTAIDGDRVTLSKIDETATFSTGITIYELNKRLAEKEGLFDWSDDEKVEQLDADIQNWFYETTKENRFYILYGRDIHYVTLVEKALGGNLLENLKEMIEEFGQTISFYIDGENGENKIEIWVKTVTGSAELLYFFPYDDGLVQI